MIKKSLVGTGLVSIGMLVLLSICSLAYGSQDILNSHGSFESKGFWSGSADYSIDESTFKEGKASAKIVVEDINAKSYLYCYLPMKSGESYKISLWYKTMNVVPDSNLVKILLNFNRKNGANGSAGAKIIPFPTGDNNSDWKELSTIVAPPPETEQCQFVISFSGIKGTIWLDGLTVSLQEKEKEQVSAVKVTDTPPVIDGLDNDKCWQDAISMSGFLRSDYGGKIADRQTEAKLSYDAQNIYVFYK
jgi:hypothetical protein